MIEADTSESISSQQQLGLLLQHTREKRNLVVSDVAAELKILTGAVKALESGEYTAIKGSVFVKGYLKAYAKFLQLDVEECLALYSNNASEKVIPPAAGIIENAKQSTSVPKIILVVIAVVMITLISLSLLLGDDSAQSAAAVSKPPESETTQQQSSEPTQADIGFLPQAESLAELEPEQLETVSPETTELVAGDSKVLSLVFTADCWVEVNDAAGKKLISDLKREGERIALRGQPPYEVLLGYGPAVTVSYEGEQVEFEVGPNPTVKLLVGEQS